VKIIITESQYKKILNEGDLTTLLIGGVAALGLYGIKVFFKIFLNVLIDSSIDGFFGYIDDIKNIVAPEPYIKFLKSLEKNEKFTNEFLKFVEESQKDGRLDGSPFWIENVTNLPSFIESFDEFTKKENIGEFEKNQLLILIRKNMIKSYARNGRKIVEALKKKMSDNQEKGLNESEQEQKVLHIPSLKVFGGDWDELQKFLKSKGNPPYSIGGDLDLRETPIESLGNLTSVEGNLDLRETPIESLGNLTSVGGDLYLLRTPIESLGNLQSVGGDLALGDTPIESLGNLTSVGGDLNLSDTSIESLGNLTSVGNSLNLRNTPIKSLGNLQSVGGSLDLLRTQIESLGNLQSVGGFLDLRRTQVKSLGNLTSVGSYLDLRGTQIKSLGNLTSVGGILGLSNTPIESLGNLQSVGVYLDLEYTPLSNKYTEEDIRQMVDVVGEIYL
jgi:hypothetical protein